MAIYHLSAKMLGRSGGRSATASAAYRSGEKIHDERQGLTFDYRRRSHSVSHTALLTPEGTPAFAGWRSSLWNAVEAAEKRCDAQVAREVEIALPRELTVKQNIALATDFAQRAFVARGMVADVCIHDAEGNNPHAHIMLTTRHLTPDGFGSKNRDWNKTELLEEWRKEWQQTCNQHLEQHYIRERVDHRSLEAQGCSRTPQRHLGVQAWGFEQRTGELSRNRIKDQMRETAQSHLTQIRERLQQQQEQAKAPERQKTQTRQRSRSFGMER